MFSVKLHCLLDIIVASESGVLQYQSTFHSDVTCQILPSVISRITY